MGAEIVLLICMSFAVCLAADLHLECGNSCSGASQQNFVDGYSCNLVEDLDLEMNESSIAAVSPTLDDVKWYVHHSQGKEKLAINVTWFIPGYTAAEAYQRAYRVVVVVDSHPVSKLFAIDVGKNSQQSLRQYNKVVFNYPCTGVDTEFLFASKSYIVMLSGVPHHPESSPTHKQVKMPDCDSEEFNISQTENCVFDEKPKPPSTTEAQPISTTTIWVHVDSNLTTIKVSLTIAAPGCLLILIIALLCYHRHKPRCLRKNILVVTSSSVSQTKNVATAINQLLSDLKKAGCEVVCSQWHETKISTLGSAEWLNRQFKVADCVIFLFYQVDEEGIASDTHKLINSPLDTLVDVGLKMLRKNMLENVEPLVLAVHFNKGHPMAIPKIFIKSHMFAYPKQASALISKIAKSLPKHV